MSEQEETTDYPPVDDAPVQGVRKRRGFGTAVVALLSLAAVAAAGYLYWRVEGIGGSGGIAARLGDDIARLEREVASTRSMSRSSVGEVQASIAELTRTLAAHGESLDRVRAELSAEDRRDGSPDPSAWRIAEVEYLLRIANSRLLMERDARGADRMLASADSILEELDDYALHGVRALIAEERMALVNTNAANAQSIFLTLEAMKDAVGELPLKQPEYFEDSGSVSTEAPSDATAQASIPEQDMHGSTPPATAEMSALPYASAVGEDPPAEGSSHGSTPPAKGEMSALPYASAVGEDPPAEGSFGEALERRFFGLFEFRTRESVAPRPLIRPEEAIYLELNLRLALERAQLAMLRGDQTLFATSLSSARKWIDEYVDPDHAATQRIAQDLDRLAGLDIEQPMPDISRSLARLRELQSRQPELEPAPEAEPGRTE